MVIPRVPRRTVVAMYVAQSRYRTCPASSREHMRAGRRASALRPRLKQRH